MNNVLSIYVLSGELRRLMMEEILGTFNRFMTFESLGHEPTNDECAHHYLTHGGVDDFRRKYNVPMAC